MDKEIMTREEVAEYMQVHPKEIGRLEGMGLKRFSLSEVPLHPKAKRRYRKSDVDAFVGRLVEEQNAPVVVHPRALEIAQGLMK